VLPQDHFVNVSDKQRANMKDIEGGAKVRTRRYISEYLAKIESDPNKLKHWESKGPNWKTIAGKQASDEFQRKILAEHNDNLAGYTDNMTWKENPKVDETIKSLLKTASTPLHQAAKAGDRLEEMAGKAKKPRPLTATNRARGYQTRIPRGVPCQQGVLNLAQPGGSPVGPLGASASRCDRSGGSGGSRALRQDLAGVRRSAPYIFHRIGSL
jgi:hypothetical protein